MKTIYLFCISFCVFFLTNSFLFGQYQIGHKQVTYTDPARSNRSIQTEIYYPATTAGDNVAVANGQFPIIVFGHGFVMVWSAYQNFWDSIVPKGYIMAFPRTEGSMSPNHSEYGLDLAFLISKLKSEGTVSTSFLYQKVGTTSAIAGHSMGGGASFLAAQNNTQITTMVVFAPANTDPPSITAAQFVTVPSVIFYGVNDGVTPPAEHQIPMYDSLASSCKTLIGINGGGHCYFANSNFNCSFGEGTTSPQPTITRDEQHAIVFSLLLPYLDNKLKGNAAAGSLFLNRLTSLSTITYQRNCTTTEIKSSEIEEKNGFVLYPNPASDYLYLSCTNPELFNEPITVTCVNSIGQIVSESLFVPGLKNKIDISSFAKGIYHIKISSRKHAAAFRTMVY